MSARPAGVLRVVFQEILEGDRRKFAAESNDSDSGGGARDLRYNDAQFGPVLRQMFPDSESTTRRRKGMSTTVTVHRGRVWTAHEGKQDQHSDVIYEPPTTARPSEGRLTRVHEMPGLIENLPDDNGQQLFLLLVQQDDGRVYAHFATLDELTKWHSAVYDPVAACAVAAQVSDRKAVGWIDFLSNQSYCHS